MFEKIKAKVARLQTKISTALFALTIDMLTRRAAILAKDKRGMVDVVDLILLGVGFFVISFLLPLGITSAIDANTTGWDPTVKTLWTVFWPLMGVLVVVIYMVAKIRS